MRVCHFTSSDLDHHYFRDLSRGLTGEGHAMVLGTLGSHPPPLWMHELTGASYFAMNVRARSGYPRAALRLARLLRDHDVDICHSHLFDGGAVGLAGAVAARRPRRILMRHHLDQHQLLDRPVHVRADRVMTRVADCTIVPSEAVRSHMREREGLRRAAIEVIPIGFDFNELREAAALRDATRRRLRIGSGFVVGYVGHLTAIKGLRTLLEAARALKPEIPDLRVLLVGHDPTDWSGNVVRDLGLRDTVIKTGFQPDAPAYMAAMDVFVQPSLSESFGQVAVEAMGVGVPVIATRVGDVERIVGSGGIVVPPGDSHALVKAIRRVCQDSALRERLAITGQSRARARYPVEAMVRAHLTVYRKYAVGPVH